ncbi:hypothetical protein DL96DRAFT_1627723 [Flagelloscypha sp. PMI_526]|nr:hypothetical protein DL96DRAFT_1627723 [Flagelloscypha sp. PMI_526]
MLNEAESAREKAKAKKQGKPFWSPETELEATLALKDAALNLQMQPCTLDFDANSQHISPHRTGPNSSTAPVTKFTEPSAKLYNQWQTTWGSKRKWYRADNNVFVLTLSTSGEMKGSLVVVCHPQISNSKTLSQAPERVGTESAKGLRENLTIKKRDDEESTPADLSDGEHSSPSSLPSTRNIDKTTHWKLFWDATPLQRLPVLPVDITLESRNRLRLIEEGTLSNVQARALTEALRWLGKSNVYSYEAATFDQNMWKNQPVPQILAKEFESRLRGMIVPIKNKDGSPISIETIVDGWMSKTLGHEVLARMTYGGRGPWIAAREWHTMFVDISKGRTIWGLQTHQRTGKKARRILKDNKVRFW